MTSEQLTALLARLKDDAGLREKLQGARDLDAAVALATEAGFDVTKEQWLKYQDAQAELSDEELEAVAGGKDQGCGILRSSLMGDCRDGGKQVTW